MQTVADRFFEAFDALLAMGETKIQTFCREGGIDKRNFYKSATTRIVAEKFRRRG